MAHTNVSTKREILGKTESREIIPLAIHYPIIKKNDFFGHNFETFSKKSGIIFMEIETILRGNFGDIKILEIYVRIFWRKMCENNKGDFEELHGNFEITLQKFWRNCTEMWEKF